MAQPAHEALRRAHGPLTMRLDGTVTEAAAVVVSKGRFYAGPYLLARFCQRSRQPAVWPQFYCRRCR